MGIYRPLPPRPLGTPPPRRRGIQLPRLKCTNSSRVKHDTFVRWRILTADRRSPSRDSRDVDLVFVARGAVLVLVGALADLGLHGVQHGAVRVSYKFFHNFTVFFEWLLDRMKKSRNPPATSFRGISGAKLGDMYGIYLVRTWYAYLVRSVIRRCLSAR